VGARGIHLNVGPSHLSDDVLRDVAEIAASGLLSESHRGPAVMDTLKAAVVNTRAAMEIPPEFEILFQPSATACMELILRNCVARASTHFVLGAFSKRCAETAERVGLRATSIDVPWGEAPAFEEAPVAADTELIAIIHCETSTGVMWPDDALRALRARHPEPLIAVDATSTFGALRTDWTQADAWFGSVQKCVGLPAGLGYAILGPRVMARAEALGAARRVAGWQDLLVMRERLALGQTVETPNVLGIALLARQMGRRDLHRVDAGTRAKAAYLAERFGDAAFFVRDPAWRSLTAHTLQVDDPAGWIARAQAAGHRLGAGYGPLKASCIRVPTYPATSIEEIARVLDAAQP
jgi:phosphoserine aminotransferase